MNSFSIKSFFGQATRSRPTMILLIDLFLILLFSRMSTHFLTVRNMEAIGYGVLSIGIVSVGMMVVMIAGGFDLSVGSTLAFTGVVAAKLLEVGTPIYAAILVALVLGALIGLVNGLLITVVGINPFIATLGTMSMVRGLALAMTQGMPVYGLPTNFAFLGDGRVGGWPVAIVIMILLVAVMDQFMRRTHWGRLFYYVGGSQEASKLSGIAVPQVRVVSYMFTGTLAALAGTVLASRMMSMMATAGAGLELKTIAASIIGGAALAGGEGTIIGAFLGTVMVGFIDNILILSNVSSYWQQFSSGAILVVVVTLDIVIRRIRERR
ncbi:MAG: ABC transporter permease [Spirochaetaceae bacterium]